jgi:phage gp36-like protein
MPVVASQQLATLTDLAQLGAADTAFPSSIDSTVKTSHLVKASGIALSYIGKRYGLPLTSWGSDVVGAVVAIAALGLFRLRGMNPENPADQLVVKAYDDAIAWLRDVAAGKAEPVGIVDSTPATIEEGPLVASDDPVGWTFSQPGQVRW